MKTPNEIEYQVAVPAEAVHGDWANLALEADGMPLGRARLQMFRPVTIRMAESVRLHFGAGTELEAQPPVAPVEPKAGTNVELSIRNNSPDIATYQLEAVGDGLEFFPVKTEISVGGVAERPLLLRVFAKDGAEGLRDWHLRVKGAAGLDLDLPMRVVVGRADGLGGGARTWTGTVRGMGAGIAEGAGGFFQPGRRAVDGIHLEGHERGFPADAGLAGGERRGDGAGRGRCAGVCGKRLDADSAAGGWRPHY